MKSMHLPLLPASRSVYEVSEYVLHICCAGSDNRARHLQAFILPSAGVFVTSGSTQVARDSANALAAFRNTLITLNRPSTTLGANYIFPANSFVCIPDFYSPPAPGTTGSIPFPPACHRLLCWITTCYCDHHYCT
jgi:hypothetical protein